MQFISLVGTNNLRYSSDPFSVLPFFEEIVQYANQYSNCYVVLLGLIPSLRNDSSSRERFSLMSKLLNKLSHKYENCGFISTASLFIENGEVCERFFKHDRLHLGKFGATILANEIVDVCVRIEKYKNHKDYSV